MGEWTSLWNRIVYNQTNLTTERTQSWTEELRELREKFAELIDLFDYIRDASLNGDKRRLASIAISKLEEACMFCVKTMTFDS